MDDARFAAPQGAAAVAQAGDRAALDAVKLQSVKRAEGLRPILAELRAEGIASANAQSQALNERGVRRRGAESGRPGASSTPPGA